ncbi:MAG TPA: hypothetical protein VMX12_09345 [Acidimicrobiia bacterium]|nr:hypothetical protein [Acidimicrobiia bacterium]
MRRTIRPCLAVAVFSVGLFGALAPPAGAADASGCNGSGTSLDSDGIRIDSATAPGRGGTKGNPFDVTADGEVRYRYDVQSPVAGGTWKVKIDTGLFPVSFGGDISQRSSQSGSGVEPLKKHLQIGGFAPLAGLIKVDIEATGPSGGTCVVSGWIKIHESVFTTPVFYLALIFLLLGILVLFYGMASPL